MVPIRFQSLLCGAFLSVLISVPACRKAPQPAMDDPVSQPRVLLPVNQYGQ
jgi:hypothetical protein